MKKLDERVDSLVADGTAPDPVLITVADAGHLLDLTAQMFDPEAGELDFNVEAVKASIRYVARQAADPTRRDRVYLLVRRGRQNRRLRSDGRYYDVPDTSEQESAIARELAIDLPMLMFFRQSGDEALGWRGSEFYWPVVHMPQMMRTVVFANDVNDFDEDNVIPP